MSLLELLPEIQDEWSAKSRSKIYERDPEAWVNDVLGKGWWSKQREIAQSYIDNRRTAVKSANGTGKSWLVADLICHYISVHEPGQSLALVSAPTLGQIEDVIFAYLKVNFGEAKARELQLRGKINEQLEWNYFGDLGKQLMVKGLKPQDKDIVGSFQGRRRQSTAVFIDEGGSVPSDLFVAMEAVTTGENGKIVTIGNPDLRGTAFFDLWNKPNLSQDWELFTISAFDLPTITGEVVYKDPAKQKAMLTGGMTNREWIEHKQRAWGEDSARYQAKVLGEFPDEADNTFFSQTAINMGLDTKIETDWDKPLILGVDIALSGNDETVIYANRGGQLRRLKTIGKMDSFHGAAEIHQFALECGASEVRVDAAGTGQGVFENLYYDPRFEAKPYELVGINGGKASPDSTQWAQARSWHYDIFRTNLMMGKYDIDPNDKELLEEMISQTYEFNNRGAIQITPKKEMRKQGLPSPDNLDAAIYASIPINDEGPQAGETRLIEPDDVIEAYVEFQDWWTF